MDKIKSDKISRVLDLYTKLLDGHLIRKAREAEKYGVNERSIQRDIDDIRSYLSDRTLEQGSVNSVVYDRAEKGYRLERIYKIRLTNSEVLAVCKILLDSRAFTGAEMKSVLDRLVSCCTPEANRMIVSDLIKNEEFHYVEPRHRTDFLDTMWEIGIAIRTSHYIEIRYERVTDRKDVTRKVMPVAIMFSEYYFYLTAFIDNEDEVRMDFDVINDSYPTIYRIDRIRKITTLDERFSIPYTDRFQEGEFRKRVQFMYGGRLRKVRFRYTGPDVDAVLDRLPTAVITDEDGEGYTISAEVFGQGIDMWLRSQGKYVEVL